MPTNDNIKLLQDELAKKLEEQKKLGYFASALSIKAAKDAVDTARKTLKEAEMREKNPNWKPHEELFSADVKHKTEWNKRAENKKNIVTNGPLQKPVKPTPEPLKFTAGVEHETKKYNHPVFEPLQVHIARDKRNAKRAAAEQALIEAEQARIEQVRLDRIKYTPLQDKKIDEAHAQFIKETPKSFIGAMLYDMKPVKKADKDKVVATVIEKKSGDDSAAAHLDNFNRLQQHEIKDKKQPVLHPVPHHSTAELARRQKLAENKRFEKSYFFQRHNNERLDRAYANQEKIEAAKQEKREALVEYRNYVNADVAEAKARDKSYLEIVTAGGNERRANIFDRMGGNDRAMREENRHRLFIALPSRNRKEITVQNVFASTPKLKP